MGRRRTTNRGLPERLYLKDNGYYYRDLNRGRWIGVNEETEYTPASLLKVVIKQGQVTLKPVPIP